MVFEFKFISKFFKPYFGLNLLHHLHVSQQLIPYYRPKLPDMIVLPFSRCHDSSQYSPSSSLFASCNDSALIFKRLMDMAFSFFSRFFQPHFLITNIQAFVACGKFFSPHQAEFFCTFTLCRFFFGRDKQAGSLPSFVSYTTDPSRN